MGVTESANTYIQEELLYDELNDQLAAARGKDLPPDFLQVLAKENPNLYEELMAIPKTDLLNPLAELDKGLIGRVDATLDSMEQKRILIELTKSGLMAGKLEVKGGSKNIEILTFASTPIKVTKSVGGMWLFEGDTNLAYENLDDVMEDLKDYQRAVSKDWGIPADREGGPFFVDPITGVTFDEAGFAMDDNVSLGNPLDKVKQNAFALHLNEHYKERVKVLGEEQNLASMFRGYGIKDVVVKERPDGSKFVSIPCEKREPILVDKSPDGKWRLEQDDDIAYADQAGVIYATASYQAAILKDWGKVEPEWKDPQAPFYIKNGAVYFASDSVLPDPVVPLSGNTEAFVQLLNIRYKHGDIIPAAPVAPSPEEVAEAQAIMAEEVLPETAPELTGADIEAFVAANGLVTLDEQDPELVSLHRELRSTSTTGEPYSLDTGKFSLNITKTGDTVQLHLSGTGERTEEENRLWDAYREAVVAELSDYKGMTAEVVPKGKHETIVTLMELPPFMSRDDFKKSEAYNPAHTPDLDSDDPAYVPMLKDGYSWASPEDDENCAFYKEEEGEAPSSDSLADAMVASPVTPAPTPSASAEVIKPIASEAEFLATLQDKGWEKYATLTGADPTTTGEILVKGLDKGTPEYKYSRIHHFFGKSGVAVKLEDPTQYEIKVDGNPAEWSTSVPQYPEGTLVKAGTIERLWVENGTKIEWKKKEAPVVAAAEVPAEPVPVAEVAPVKVEPTKEELAAIQVEVSEIGHDYEILRAEELALNVTVEKARREGRYAFVGAPQQAAFAARYRALEGRVAALEGKLTPEQVAALKLITDETSKALARLEPSSTTSPETVTRTVEPAGKSLKYPDGSTFVGTFTEAGVPLKGTYTNATGDSVEVQLDPANLEAPFDMMVGGEKVSMRWDDGDVPGHGGFIRADMGLPAEEDGSVDVEPETPAEQTNG